MKIIIALPDHQYFLWQILVQINNFKKFNIEQDVIYLIGKSTRQLSPTLQKIINNGRLGCSFHVFNDERINKGYSVSLRAFLMRKFFEKYPEMQKETYLFTDPDVIFTKKMDFSSMLNDNIWYLSDTRSYLNSIYIKSKSKELFNEMCDIVEIDPKLVVKNDNNAGGAQYIMKNTTIEFWKKVEKDCELLYRHMVTTANKYSPEHPIQSWTADMWGTLWNAWYFGHETKIDKSMDFSWATDEIKRWNETSIFHNAGVIGNGKDGMHFSKVAHQISPFNKDLTCSTEYCSYNYVNEIKETEKNLSKIIF